MRTVFQKDCPGDSAVHSLSGCCGHSPEGDAGDQREGHMPRHREAHWVVCGSAGLWLPVLVGRSGTSGTEGPGRREGKVRHAWRAWQKRLHGACWAAGSCRRERPPWISRACGEPWTARGAWLHGKGRRAAADTGHAGWSMGPFRTSCCRSTGESVAPPRVAANCVWEGGVLGPAPQENALMCRLFCTLSGVWSECLWVASGPFASVPILYAHKVRSQGQSTRPQAGSTTEAGPLLAPQGDMVNYDEIKRFIRQEIMKMFDGNWRLLGGSGCRGPFPATSLPGPGLRFLKAQYPTSTPSLSPTYRPVFNKTSDIPCRLLCSEIK